MVNDDSGRSELNRFFADIERRALYMAKMAINDHEEALDLVQDAMLKLAEKYSKRPSSEWGPLFYRILQSRIRDWYRRNAVRRRVLSWFGSKTLSDEYGDSASEMKDEGSVGPLRQLESDHFGPALIQALQQLPMRQQQVFMLRVWEGFNVRQTAVAMGCAEGSVKTHYSRAIHTLRDELVDYR